MSKKRKTVFVCQQCGYESARWQGQCICGAWNSMVEEIAIQEEKHKGTLGFKGQDGSKAKPKKLKDIEDGEEIFRISTGLKELDRVLGGGMVPGGLTLISGEPGIGKSTIIMQSALHVAQTRGPVLYVSGEESQEQIKLRSQRIGGNVIAPVYILSETNVEVIEKTVEEIKPQLIIIDSIQTMYCSEPDSAPGSVSQVRACGNYFMTMAKKKNIPLFLVAHVTKSGELAGPKIVEHLVDCVLYFSGERDGELRLMRSLKNRYGTTSEIGAFVMGASGLVEIEDLSKRFIEESKEKSEGTMVTAIYEGTRPLLLEVQALVTATNMNFPRRTAIGIDLARLNMIIAVLEKKARLSLSSQDVYVNIVGGLKPQGTSMDLAVALAIHSSYYNKVSPRGVLAIGELGLTGDLRSIPHVEKIIDEAHRMGYTKILLPGNQARKLSKKKNMVTHSDVKTQKGSIVGVDNLKEALENYFLDEDNR